MDLYFQDPTGQIRCLQGANAQALAPLLPPGWTPATPAQTLAALKAAALTQVRARRVQAFADLAGLQSEALALGDTAKAQAITTLQQMLRDLPATDLSACQTQADIEAAFKAAWQAIKTAAPQGVGRVFDDVLN